jgi:two-component system LytT family response regulator
VSTERYTISHRLHALESRLDPRKFVRLSRGAIVALDLIEKFSPLPGGLYQVQLSTGQTLTASRIQSRVLRETLLRM